ncbi:hypothetical protein [Bacteroides salyersiae]|uniref:hypothetical protein n=1 Tax=Bacteroides salyersiae TaxID=291644 RepID=UPI0018996E4B|nr:hypothetical protein [Bacteroides salyersiae]
MKKRFFLLVVICCISLGTTLNAQIQNNKTDLNIGYVGMEALENGNYRLLHSFNLSEDWKKSKRAVTEKLLSSNGKGVYGMGITTEGINSNQATWIENGMTLNPNSNLTFIWVPSAKALRDSLSKDSDFLKHEYWKAACCLWDVPGTEGKDQAFTVWPGMAKRRIMSFHLKAQDGLAGLLSDVQFDLLTLDKGNTGKAASYKMILDLSKQPAFPWIHASYGKTGDDVALLDSISESNVGLINSALGSKLYVKDDVYLSSLEDGNLNRVTIKVAETFGLQLKDLRNRKIMVTLYSTTSSTPVQPGMYEPIVGIDNISVPEYGLASWIEPNIPANEHETVEYNAKLNEAATFKFILKGKNRMSDLKITSSGDTKASLDFFFEKQGAVMGKDATGNYTVPVDYSYSAADGNNKELQLKIGASKEGPVDDDYEFALSMRAIEKGKVRKYQLEIDNGTRIWKDITVNLSEGTGVNNIDYSSVEIITGDNLLKVKNATEPVVIANTIGQIVKTATVEEASGGVVIPSGVYVVQTGKFVKKVYVK